MKLLILAFGSSLALTRVACAGTIAGVVRGADGSTITIGSVTASRQPDSMRLRLGRTAAGAAIRSDGTFQLPSLADGTYQVCVQAPGTPWLPSCEWGRTGNTVSLTRLQPSVQVSIVLVRGAEVTIRVNDPSQLLTAHEGRTAGAHLLVGVGGDSGFFRTAAIVSRSPAGRTYQALIPFDRSVNVSVASARFELSDATGRALSRFGNLIPVRVPSGQAFQTVVLNVQGISAPPGR